MKTVTNYQAQIPGSDRVLQARRKGDHYVVTCDGKKTPYTVSKTRHGWEAYWRGHRVSSCSGRLKDALQHLAARFNVDREIDSKEKPSKPGSPPRFRLPGIPVRKGVPLGLELWLIPGREPDRGVYYTLQLAGVEIGRLVLLGANWCFNQRYYAGENHAWTNVSYCNDRDPVAAATAAARVAARATAERWLADEIARRDYAAAELKAKQA